MEFRDTFTRFIMNKAYYRRRLPHVIPPGETFFVTFRLAGSLPTKVIEQLQQERDEFIKAAKKQKLSPLEIASAIQRSRKMYFGKFDSLLDKAGSGPVWLNDDYIAVIVKNALHFGDKKEFDLIAYCVMSNHVHAVLKPKSNEIPLYRIMQSIKRFSSKEANIKLNRTGQPFWQAESYDHLIRNDGELRRVITYVLNNPVKAGLVNNWEEWKFSFVKDRYL